jgi:hypothetical protein
VTKQIAHDVDLYDTQRYVEMCNVDREEAHPDNGGLMVHDSHFSKSLAFFPLELR